MSNRIRLTLLATIALGIGSLVLGGFGAAVPSPAAHSPYLSAMSDLSVPPAEAVPCNLKVCVFIDNPGPNHDHWDCTDSFSNTHCLLGSGGSSCTNIDPCP